MCATIRWSGRTDWPSTCQLPLEDLQAATRPCRRARRAAPRARRATWPIVGRYESRIPPGSSAVAACLTTRQGSGGRGRCGRGRRRRCRRTRRGPRRRAGRRDRGSPRRCGAPGRRSRRAARSRARVRSRRRPQQRHGQRTRAHTGLEHLRSGEHVGVHQDRAEVLRVDHLRAARHLEDVLGEGGADCHQAAPIVVRTVTPSSAPMSV